MTAPGRWSRERSTMGPSDTYSEGPWRWELRRPDIQSTKWIIWELPRDERVGGEFKTMKAAHEYVELRASSYRRGSNHA